jgi:hypothetical protein
VFEREGEETAFEKPLCVGMVGRRHRGFLSHHLDCDNVILVALPVTSFNLSLISPLGWFLSLMLINHHL